MVPIFRAEDMLNLGTREFFIKMTIDGETFDPFSAETLKILPPTHPSYKEEIIEQSRKKYTKPLKEVKDLLEQEIAERVKLDQEKIKETVVKEVKEEKEKNEKGKNEPLV